jgi:hypothetical protein
MSRCSFPGDRTGGVLAAPQAKLTHYLSVDPHAALGAEPTMT